MSAKFPLKVLSSPERWPESERRPVVVLGNFDGLHQGHRALLAEARRLVPESPVLVFTFHPHPAEILAERERFRRLFSENQQLDLLQRFGADAVYLQKFDRAISELEHQDFLALLEHHLRPAGLVVGFNFRYGRGRKGSVETLKAWSAEKSILLKVVSPVMVGGENVSSTRIRDHLLKGEIEQANALLGFSFFVEGLVVRGAQRGRDLGFPTANVDLPDTLAPLSGVYVTRLMLSGTENFAAISNLGTAPTFDKNDPRLETFVLDEAYRSQQIYGLSVRVEFLKFLRPEKKFVNPDELKQQIALDIKEAREVHDDFHTS